MSDAEINPVAARRRTEISDELYLVRIEDEAMSPRYELGETVSVNMDLRPTLGDDVAITFLSEPEGFLVRRLVGCDGRNLRLRQHNPPGEIDIRMDEVDEIHPCVSYEPPLLR